MRSGSARRSGTNGVVVWGFLFFAMTAFYATTYSFRSINDTDLNSYMTRALVLHGDVDIARYAPQPDKITSRFGYTVYRDGHRYTITSVAISLTAAPLYALFVRLDLSDLALQAAASIPFVVAGALLLFRLLLQLVPKAVAVGGTVIYAFGTTMWPVAAMGFFMHGPASLYQAIGLTGLFSTKPRAALLAGLGFGAAAWVRPQLAVPLVLVGILYLIENKRGFFLYGAGVLPALLGVLIQNRWLYGTWFTTGYNQAEVGWQGDVPHATFQLLFGWWRGIFIYSPVLIVGVLGALLAAGNIRGFVERRMVILGVASMALVLVYALRSDWTGGLNQFGYRYLLDIVPFLVVLTAFGVARARSLRALALPLGVLSVMIMVVGAESNDYGWDATQFPRDVEHTPLGQSWIVFVDRPLGAVLRLVGVAAIAGLLRFAASRMPERGADSGLAVPLENNR